MIYRANPNTAENGFSIFVELLLRLWNEFWGPTQQLYLDILAPNGPLQNLFVSARFVAQKLPTYE